MATVLPLDEVGGDDLLLVGGKAANLGEMLRAGMPVPPGFVVTTDAYRAHLSTARLDEPIARRLADLSPDDGPALEAAAADVSGWILASPVPPTVEKAVRAARRRLDTAAVAVRSSATAEDLATASFAGQQQTFLGVRGDEELLAAVQRCWAGLWSPRAVLYRLRFGHGPAPIALAVVVQAMVDAEVAGVLFTCDPVGGARGRFVVSASYGLGEAVVAGLVTPDTFALAPDGRVMRRRLGTKERRMVPSEGGTRVEEVAPGDRGRFCLDASGLAALAALGRRVAEHYDTPQDIEWAQAAGRLHLLQTRPVTVLPPARPAPRPGRLARVFLEQLADRLPEPLTPMDLSLSIPLLYGGVFGLLADFGLKVPSVDHALVELPDGRFAVRPRLPSLRPAMLWRLPSTLVRAAREDPMVLWGPVERDLREGARQLERAPLGGLDAVGLAAHVRGFETLLRSILARRFRALLPGLIHDGLTRFWVRRAVGGRAAPAVMRRLYLDLPYRTALMNRAVAHLTAVAREHGRESPAFGEGMRVFLAEWGDRPARGMEPAPSFPTLREDPRPVLALVDALQRNPDACGPGRGGRDEAEELAAARAQVATRLGRAARRAFLIDLERARALILAREDSLFALEKAVARLRGMLLALGDRLATAGVLTARNDIFLLTTSELTPAAAGTAPLQHVVERRRRAYERIVQAHERGENWLVAAGTLPPPRLAATQPTGTRLSGQPAGGGRATGPARLVRGPEEFAHVRVGDVLVCRATSPTWTPLFRLAAAVVTDVGSPLSHAAIVAREYNIPAVVAIGNATAVIRDGESVTVDGDAGWVGVGERPG